jgi:F0F1-type ATP synthase assembly protein I
MTDGQAPKPTRGANDGWAVLSTLLGGLIVWGGIGWLVDKLLHTHIALPIGLLVGMAGSLYLIVKKYGSSGTT